MVNMIGITFRLSEHNEKTGGVKNLSCYIHISDIDPITDYYNQAIIAIIDNQALQNI